MVMLSIGPVLFNNFIDDLDKGIKGVFNSGPGCPGTIFFLEDIQNPNGHGPMEPALSMLLDKMIVTDPFQPTDQKTQTVTTQPIPYPPSPLARKSMSFQFRDKKDMQDSVKCFAPVQAPLLSTNSVIMSWKATRFFRHNCENLIRLERLLK
ncbi:hypothetical protein TURU_088526 [Turdus rufiventris]|nr:hypothetical protein TURU_088526 [Turdus rufiventris]